jgi:hypothetical protein
MPLCRRPIKLSPVCQFEMTLAVDFSKVFRARVRPMSDVGLTRLEAAQDLDQRRLRLTAAVA